MNSIAAPDAAAARCEARENRAITPRTFQVRGSGRWTLDLLIGRHWGLRAFSGPRTYPTEESAIRGCCDFGRRIIDGLVRNLAVDDLS